MDSKDTRFKDKRTKMKTHRNTKQRVPQTGGNTTSSSSQVEAVRGIIDVADSSDDRYANRSTSKWSPNVLPSMDDLDLADDENNPQMHAGDFNLMSQMPTSVGGHFQFSSEKNWDTDELLIGSTEASEYFTLNLKLLNVGLKTIPFYKRMDLASSMFSKQQLQVMNSEADAAETQYQSVLREHENNPRITVKNGDKRTASAKSLKNDTVANSAKLEQPDDELDALLNMTADAGSNISQLGSETVLAGAASVVVPALAAAVDGQTNLVAAAAENKEDIQQWLDNVLEE